MRLTQGMPITKTVDLSKLQSCPPHQFPSTSFTLLTEINVDSGPVTHNPSIHQSIYWASTMRVTTNFSILGLLALVSSTAAKMTTVSVLVECDSNSHRPFWTLNSRISSGRNRIDWTKLTNIHLFWSRSVWKQQMIATRSLSHWLTATISARSMFFHPTYSFYLCKQNLTKFLFFRNSEVHTMHLTKKCRVFTWVYRRPIYLTVPQALERKNRGKGESTTC